MISKPTIALLLALGAGLSACSQEKSSSEVATAPREATPPATPAVATAPTADGPAMSVTDEGGSSVMTTQDAEGILISGNNSVQTRKVDGQDIQIIGDDNQATFTGRAKTFSAAGNANVVTLENVELIKVIGDDNNITWSGTTPTINNFGKNNRIAQAK